MFGKQGDGGQSAIDRRRVGQGGRDPCLELARPCGGDGHVHDGKQAAVAGAIRPAGKFEACAGGSVDCHQAAVAGTARRLEHRRRAGLGEGHVVDQRPGGGDLRAGEITERIQRPDAEQAFKPAAGGVTVEGGRPERGKRNAGLLDGITDHLIGEQALMQHKFAGGEARQGGGQGRGVDRLDLEGAGGDIRIGEAEGLAAVSADTGEGCEDVGIAGVQQGVFREGAGGDDAHHSPLDDGFGATLLGLCRVLGLLADGNTEALADEAGEIGVGGMDGDAAHGDVFAQMLAALGERDVERLGRLGRIIEEQLVEITHAVEQQAVLMRCLDLEILRHHRRRRGFGGRRVPGQGGCGLGVFEDGRRHGGRSYRMGQQGGRRATGRLSGRPRLRDKVRAGWDQGADRIGRPATGAQPGCAGQALAGWRCGRDLPIACATATPAPPDAGRLARP